MMNGLAERSHHVFIESDVPPACCWLSRATCRAVSAAVTLAIVEDEGSETAVGVWFPDLPGCFSGRDNLDEALRNAPQAIALYAQALAEDGRELPSP